MPFILDRPGSNLLTFIFFLKSFPDGRLKYPVKEKVHPDNWNPDLQRVKDDRDRINTILSRIELVYQDLETQSRLHGKPLSKLATENAFNKALGRVIAGRNFFEVIDQIIDDRESGKELTKDSKRFSAHTIKGYRHTRDNLYKFDSRMTFEGITMKTYNEVLAFFNGKDFDHAINTIGKTVKNWKVFLKAAKKRGAHDNLIYLDEDFKVPDEETDDVYLSEAELKTIYEKHYVIKTLDLVRDWFIIDCFTGLRISDIQVLDAQHILKDRIRLINEKTDTKVVIPIHPYVKAILKKHGGLPRKITDQKMNENIKKVCEIAGINEPVLYSVTKGGKRKDFHLKKYEMVSNHTARRCFITNLLNAGEPDNRVMQLAGIKKHATLLRYKKTKPEETADIMQERPFFKEASKSASKGRSGQR
jgi:integrase